MSQTFDFPPSFGHSARTIEQKRWAVGIRCLRVLSLVAFIGLCGIYGGTDQALAQVVSTDKKAIVAAGFGYQIGSVSAISVKVYEADSGAIISDDVYELTVKEGDGARKNEGAVFLRVVSDQGLQISPTSFCESTTRIPGYSNGKADSTSCNLMERAGGKPFRLENLVGPPSQESVQGSRLANSRYSHCVR